MNSSFYFYKTNQLTVLLSHRYYLLERKKILVNLTGPISLRKSLIEQVTKYIKRNSITININQKKCFNGCRPPKKRRKKQKGLRLFK